MQDHCQSTLSTQPATASGCYLSILYPLLAGATSSYAAADISSLDSSTGLNGMQGRRRTLAVASVRVSIGISSLTPFENAVLHQPSSRVIFYPGVQSFGCKVGDASPAQPGAWGSDAR